MRDVRGHVRDPDIGRVLEEMGDGTGVVMLDGEMQDDATVKQCRVMVDLAKRLAKNHKELQQAYGFSDADLKGA